MKCPYLVEIGNITAKKTKFFPPSAPHLNLQKNCWTNKSLFLRSLYNFYSRIFSTSRKFERLSPKNRNFLFFHSLKTQLQPALLRFPKTSSISLRKWFSRTFRHVASSGKLLFRLRSMSVDFWSFSLYCAQHRVRFPHRYGILRAWGSDEKLFKIS